MKTRSRRWQRNRNLPAPPSGSAMKAACERSQERVTCRTCGRLRLPGGVGRKKDPTVAPQKAPFTLVRSGSTGRVETRGEQTGSCGPMPHLQQTTQGEASGHVRTSKCKPHYRAAQEGTTWGPRGAEANGAGAVGKERNVSGTERGPAGFNHFQRRVSQHAAISLCCTLFHACVL